MGPDHKNWKIFRENNSFIVICNVNYFFKYVSNTNDLERVMVLRALKSTKQLGGVGEPVGGPVILSY